MQIRRYIMPRLASNMYIISEGDAALVIDPHESVEAMAFINKSAFASVDLVLTHEHFDHISGVPFFEHLSRHIYASKKCAEIIAEPRRGREMGARRFLEASGEPDMEARCPAVIASKTFEGELRFEWQGHLIKMKETPGHSPGSVCIVIDGDKVFTGDSLFPKGFCKAKFLFRRNADYEKTTKPFLLSLDENALVYPGHGDITPLNYCMF